jgi:hypothetical protein
MDRAHRARSIPGAFNQHRLGKTLGDISVVNHFEGAPVRTVDLQAQP